MKIMLSAAALAFGLGAAVAFAEPGDEQTTTTTVQTPAGVTKTTTKTTESTNGYATFRKTVTSTKHYDAGPFAAPQGYTYVRYGLGQKVPADLMAVTLNDYGQYALVAPPSGLVWVRVGNDALLVDSTTGEVVQADYDLFRG
jgi:Ni/Co efflux regulator RcnB